MPLIPLEDIKKSEHAYEAYQRINKTERFSLEFRDASLGIGLPVVCAIIYDKARRGYRIDFGAFLIMRIALDRSINELLQGYNINNLNTVEYWTYDSVGLCIADETRQALGYTDEKLKGGHWLFENIKTYGVW